MDAVWLYCNTPLTTHPPGLSWVGMGIYFKLRSLDGVKVKQKQIKAYL